VKLVDQESTDIIQAAILKHLRENNPFI